MSDLPESALAKLPKWAAEAYRLLRRDRDHWRDTAMLGSDPTSNVLYDKRVAQDYGLPRNTRVTFRLGDGPTDYVDVAHGSSATEGNVLSVRAGVSKLRVHPEAANCISVSIER